MTTIGNDRETNYAPSGPLPRLLTAEEAYVPANILEALPEDTEDTDRRSLHIPIVQPGISSDWSVLPHQKAALQFLLRNYGSPDRRDLACLGSYAGGKTRSAAMAFFAACAKEPWRPEYGDRRPLSLLMAPTFRTLRQATLVQLLSVVPRDAIVKIRGQPHNDIWLSNGHVIGMVSAVGELEGQNVVNVWCDEIADPAFGEILHNINSRIREPLAKQLNWIVSGIAAFGFVKDFWDKPESPSHKVVLSGANQNPFIRGSVREKMLASLPEGTDLNGSWAAMPGAVYTQWNDQLHIVARPANMGRKFVLSFDVGEQGCVLIGQRFDLEVKDSTGKRSRDVGLHIHGEYLPDNKSVREACQELKTNPRYAPFVASGIEAICIDSTSDRDELASVTSQFPGVPVIFRKSKSDPLRLIDVGVRLVKRALKDYVGNVRLTFSPAVRGNKRGVIERIPKYRYNQVSEQIVRDNKEHCLDALRYMVCFALPETRPSAPEVRYSR